MMAPEQTHVSVTTDCRIVDAVAIHTRTHDALSRLNESVVKEARALLRDLEEIVHQAARTAEGGEQAMLFTDAGMASLEDELARSNAVVLAAENAIIAMEGV